MATLSLDFLRNYRLGTYRESEPVAYQYDQGHVLDILVPGAVASAEVQYWTRGMTEAAAYEVGSITQQTDGSYVIECNVPNEFFDTWGDLRVYLVVTDDSKYVVTYEGRIKVLQREKPEDYVDDDPDNEALRVLTEAREAAQSASADADRAAQVAASIPSDYSELSGNVSNLTGEVGQINERLESLDERVEALEAGGAGSGLTEDIKAALLQLASKVAYIDDGGRDYYDDLFDALYPPVPATSVTLNNNSLQFNSIGATSQLSATVLPLNTTDTVSWTSSDPSVATVSSNGLVTSVSLGSVTITATAGNVSATCSVVVAQATVSSISAVFTQSGTVYNSDDLDSLKDNLVVTATWSDSSTTTVASADYTLSGTLTVGTSSVTVNYAGKTTTFNVTVTASPYLYYWDFTKSLDDKINGTTATLTNCTRTNSGIEFNSAASAASHLPEGNQYIELGDVFSVGKTIEIELSDVAARFGNINANIIEFWDGENDPGTYNAFGWRYSGTATNRGWGCITTDAGGWGYAKSDIKTTKTFLDGDSCVVKLSINELGEITVYKDGVDMEILRNGSKLSITTQDNARYPIIGSKLYYPNFYNLTVKSIKIYATEAS